MLPAVVWARGRAQIALREDRRRKQNTAFAPQTRSTFHDRVPTPRDGERAGARRRRRRILRGVGDTRRETFDANAYVFGICTPFYTPLYRS
jgi:hypothetical protein